MHKTIRQSMAWLHSWTGLLLGWLLFAIFIMGTASYYRENINLWMQPQLAEYHVQQETAMRSTYQYFNEHASDAKSWYMKVATPESPVTRIYWMKKEGGYESKTLDPMTGQEINLSATLGGDFFYAFHYQLFGVPYLIGRLVVCFAALIMFIALISGIITHKKIFTDFFTLRTFKSQRSWLDFHNMVSVIALPFFLMITFTGLTIFFYLYLPFGIKKLYPDDQLQFFNELRNHTVAVSGAPEPAQNIGFDQVLGMVKQQWGNAQIESIDVDNPNTNQAALTIMQTEDHSITGNKPQMTIDLATGTVLGSTRNDSAMANLAAGVTSLHIANFAQPLLRFALFFSGLLGCLMIASGLLLWSLKRQIQQKVIRFHFGHYLVDRLNVASFVGLPLAMLAYLYANRMVNITLDTPNYEIYSFFIVWLISFLAALVTKKFWLWRSQLIFLIVAALALPLLNAIYLFQNQMIKDLNSYWIFFRVDLFFIFLALFGFFIYRNIQPIQKQAAAKLEKKIKARVQNSEVNLS